MGVPPVYSEQEPKQLSYYRNLQLFIMLITCKSVNFNEINVQFKM